MEIIAWDSSYTIIKFTEKAMSDKFKEYFDEAIELEIYVEEEANRLNC